MLLKTLGMSPVLTTLNTRPGRLFVTLRTNEWSGRERHKKSRIGKKKKTHQDASAPSPMQIKAVLTLGLYFIALDSSSKVIWYLPKLASWNIVRSFQNLRSKTVATNRDGDDKPVVYQRIKKPHRLVDNNRTYIPASYLATSVTPFVIASTAYTRLRQKLEWTERDIPVKSPAKAYCGIMSIFSVTFQRSLSSVNGLSSSVSKISGPSPDWNASMTPFPTKKETYVSTHLWELSEKNCLKKLGGTYIPDIFLLARKPVKCLHQHNSLTNSEGHQNWNPGGMTNLFPCYVVDDHHTGSGTYQNKVIQSTGGITTIMNDLHRCTQVKNKLDPFRPTDVKSGKGK